MFVDTKTLFWCFALHREALATDNRIIQNTNVLSRPRWSILVKIPEQNCDLMKAHRIESNWHEEQKMSSMWPRFWDSSHGAVSAKLGAEVGSSISVYPNLTPFFKLQGPGSVSAWTMLVGRFFSAWASSRLVMVWANKTSEVDLWTSVKYTWLQLGVGQPAHSNLGIIIHDKLISHCHHIILALLVIVSYYVILLSGEQTPSPSFSIFIPIQHDPPVRELASASACMDSKRLADCRWYSWEVLIGCCQVVVISVYQQYSHVWSKCKVLHTKWLAGLSIPILRKFLAYHYAKPTFWGLGHKFHQLKQLVQVARELPGIIWRIILPASDLNTWTFKDPQLSTVPVPLFLGMLQNIDW